MVEKAVADLRKQLDRLGASRYDHTGPGGDVRAGLWVRSTKKYIVVGDEMDRRYFLRSSLPGLLRALRRGQSEEPGGADWEWVWEELNDFRDKSWSYDEAQVAKRKREVPATGDPDRILREE